MEAIKIVAPLVVNGVLLFALQQWMQQKFRKIDTRASRETTYMTKSGELLIEAYKGAWATLCDLEAYLLADFPEDFHVGIESVTGLAKRMRYDYGKIRGQLPFLSENLSQRTEAVIKQVFTYYNTLISAINTIGEMEQEIDKEEALKLLNAALGELHHGFRRELDDLMNDYRQAIRETLLGDYR